ncbi:unnamed protein product [Adineta steineri]|uniref:TRAF-type domain-containing protein n=1 Tax=Adineta steineri TaxID=433720 RepID=A0A814AEN1_9BILA|nr:unnamed protein product [Adineta steineri]CAF3821407.1 unnamed protein product [Adineta steineri]
MLDRLRVTCSRCGQKDVQRENFNDHFKKSCPKLNVICSAADRKCPWMGPQDQLSIHLTSCVFHSLRSVLEEFITENRQLREQLMQQTTQISTLQNQVRQLQEQIVNHTTDIQELQNEEQHQNSEMSAINEWGYKHEDEMDQLWENINRDAYHNYQLQNWIAKCEHRSKLSLSQIPLSDRDMNIVIVQGLIYKQCTKLELRANEITTEGIFLLAEALQSNTTLLTLDLRGNNILDEGVYALTNALSTANTTLKLLNFSDNNTTDQGAEYFARMLETNETLTHLWLDTNQIGDQGIQMLADTLMHRNTSLEQLYLNDNKLVTDASVDYLVFMLENNRTLQLLEMSNCNLSEAGKEKLNCVEKSKSFKLIV